MLLLHHVLRSVLCHDLRPVLRPGPRHLLQHLRSSGVVVLLLEWLRLHGGIGSRDLLRVRGDHILAVGHRLARGEQAGCHPSGAGEDGIHFGGCAVTSPPARALPHGSACLLLPRGMLSRAGVFS